jgi:hypothetical protein
MVDPMANKKSFLAAALLALALPGMAAAADPADAADRPSGGQGRDLDLTMRIIENPAALGAEAVTRRIPLPPPVPAIPDAREDKPPERGASEEAREKGREFGKEAAERARDRAERAAERGEDFGRSRAEKKRPGPPRPPKP